MGFDPLPDQQVASYSLSVSATKVGTSDDESDGKVSMALLNADGGGGDDTRLEGLIQLKGWRDEPAHVHSLIPPASLFHL